MVTDFDVLHELAARDDDTRALVAANEGHLGGERPVALHGVQVGVADAGVLDVDEHLVGAGLRNGDLLVHGGCRVEHASVQRGRREAKEHKTHDHQTSRRPAPTASLGSGTTSFLLCVNRVEVQNAMPYPTRVAPHTYSAQKNHTLVGNGVAHDRGVASPCLEIAKARESVRISHCPVPSAATGDIGCLLFSQLRVQRRPVSPTKRCYGQCGVCQLTPWHVIYPASEARRTAKYVMRDNAATGVPAVFVDAVFRYRGHSAFVLGISSGSRGVL